VLVPGRSLDVAALLDAVGPARVHTMVIVGDAFGRPIVDALDQHPGNWDISCLEEVMSSGVMWSEDNKRAFLRHNTTMTLVDSLASSEALGVGRSTMTVDSSTPTATFELTSNAVIVDEKGAIVPPTPGASGRLGVRRSIPLGYYNDDENTRRTFVEIDGERLAIPGDFARYDAHGKVQLLGRGSTCINTGGEKVFPEEVEEALRTHDAVADVAVVGVPDDRFGQSIVAMVALSTRAVVPTPAELARHVRTQLASYKAPRTILIVDAVPRTPSGKLDYPAIEHRLQARASSAPATAGT
jgi:fatty-acyl-CoA synthase